MFFHGFFLVSIYLELFEQNYSKMETTAWDTRLMMASLPSRCNFGERVFSIFLVKIIAAIFNSYSSKK